MFELWALPSAALHALPEPVFSPCSTWVGACLGFLKPCSTAPRAAISSALLTKFSRKLWKDVAICLSPQQKALEDFSSLCDSLCPLQIHPRGNETKPLCKAMAANPTSQYSVIYFVNCLRQLFLQSYHSVTPLPLCPRARHSIAVTAMPSTQQP